MALLSVDKLSLAIGGRPILSEVSLGVERGEVLGLIGESGSGKSLTALAIMQLLPPRSVAAGSVNFDGMELLGQPDRALRPLRGARIGMVFQEPMTALNPVRSIGEQVAEAIRIHRGGTREAAMAEAARVLGRVELAVPLDRYPHELSGGQRQRVVIAMAIANAPDLVIADEPTTALDVTTQAQILKLLERLVDEDGMALMLISHDLGVVAERADRVAIMQRGRIVEQGPTLPLFAGLSHPYSRALFAAARHEPVRQAPATSGARPVLDVRDAVCAYPLKRRGLFAAPRLFRAVDGVSLTVAEGESVGLVGESGCGKSTLARAILGLEPLKGGSITLGGEAIAADGHGPTPAQRREVQIVFQDPYGSFDPRQKVVDLVAEPFHLLGREAPRGSARRDQVAAAFREVGLPADAAERHIHEFSGGQRQRIAIARALLIRPRLIVLDEPVSALDVTVRAQILDLLAELSSRLGLSYLFISHDLGVVRAITDRVIVMRKGRVVEEGTTETVLTAPREDYTRELVAASPVLDTVLARRTAGA